MAKFQLRTKFLLSLILTTAVLTGADRFIVQTYMRRHARRDIHDALNNSVMTFEQFDSMRRGELARLAVLLADFPSMRSRRRQRQGGCQDVLPGPHESHPFNLICMDVIMPEMDGHMAVRQIRNLERTNNVLPRAQAKIIVTTALSDRSNVIVAAREQCDVYLVKPIDTEVLLNQLKSFGLLKSPSESS